MAEKSFGVKEIKIDGTGTPTIESPSGGNLSVGGNLTDSGSGTPTIASRSGGNLNITAATSAFSGDVTLADVKKVRLGNTAGDFDIYYDNNAYLTTGSRGFVINSYINSFAINGGSNSDFKFGVNYLGTISAGDFVPGSDNTYDLGIASINWRNLYLDGTANVGSLVASTITGNLTGNADTATKVNIQETNSGTRQIVFCAQNGTGNQDLYIDTNDSHLSYDPNLGRLYLPNYTGGSGGTSGSGLHHLSSTTISRDGMTVGADQSASSPGYLSSNCIRFDAQTGNLNATGIATATTLNTSSLVVDDATSASIKCTKATGNNYIECETTTGTDNFSSVFFRYKISGKETEIGHSGPNYIVQQSGSQPHNPFYGPDTSFIKNEVADKGNFKVQLYTTGYSGNRNHFVVTDQGSATLGITTTRGGLHSVYSGNNGDVIALGALGAATNELDNVAPDDDANTLIILPGGRNKEGMGGTLLFNSYDNDHGYSAILGMTSYGNNGGGFKFASNTGTRPTGGIDSTNSSIIEFTRQGDIVFDAGQGLNFSNTSENGEASPDDVLFNDFERGTWIPSLSFAYSGNNTGISYAWREGQYIKFDKLVTCWGALKLNNKGSSSGAILLDDLPFAVENVAIHENIEGGGYTTKMQGLSYSTERSHWSVTPIQSVNYAYFRRFTGSSSNDENPNQGNISSSWEVHFTLQYYS